MRWYPIITFWQVAADMTNAAAVPGGHGHNYGDFVLDGWVAVAPPDGWTPDDTERIRVALEKTRVRRRARILMRPSKVRAVALAAALVGWSFAAPRVRWHPIPNASLGTGLVAISRLAARTAPARAVVGRAVRPGRRRGGGARVSRRLTAVPRVRAAMAERELPEHPGRWLLLGIPIGTVWPEEAAYRATLGTLAEEAFGPTRGRLLQAAAFGLWHIVDARVTGEPVIGTVLVTGVGGLGVRLAACAVGQPRRADAGASGGQRGRGGGGARRATAR